MENKEMETLYNLVNLKWSKKKVLGIVDKNLEFFSPFTRDLLEKLVKESARPGPFLENDERYIQMKEHMEKQQKEAEEIASYMAKMSDDERKEFIKAHVDVIATSDDLKIEVLDWLVELCNTPEGRQNIALAMGSAEGEDDGKFFILLGTEEHLQGADGWASTYDSLITLSEESWKSAGDWNKKKNLPHEICHLGQEDVENLSNRERALYKGLLVEAQARLVEFCDGVTEGRNDSFEGFLHPLKDDLEAVVKDLEKSGVLKENMTSEDFIKLKDTNRSQYDLIMGRIKEKQFSRVLNNLGKTPIYQRQGLYEHSGPGNLSALKAWVEVVCKRTGMRKDVIWPEVCAMATGAKEIPGYENCFTQEGKRSEIGKQKHELAQKLVDLGFGGSMISSCVKEGNEVTVEDGNRNKCLCTLDENGQVKEKNWTLANGNKYVCIYKNGQLREENLTDVNGNKRVCSYENGQLKTQITKYANGVVMTKEFGSKTNKIIVKKSDGHVIIRFEDKDGKLLPEDYTAENEEQPSVASESENDKASDDKLQPKQQDRSLGNGKGLDDILLAKQQAEAQKSLGNGIGLDDKLQAKQQAEAQKSLGNGIGLDDKLQAKQQAEERVAKAARSKGKDQNA